ncbi:MAG: prolipoprotein diacylglyceryl transferase [Anaplasma sp.]
MSICFAIQGLAQLLLDLDPTVLRIGPLAIKWYALAYIFGILFAYWYVGRVWRHRPEVHDKFLDSLVSWSVMGIILGGRIAYVLFYNADFYAEYPLETLKIWHGGMSFHGGCLGCIAGIIIVCRKYKMGILSVLDTCARPAPFGLFLGRLANLINGELYGKVTDSCVGVVFRNSGTTLPRHPSQLYEAVLEGLLLLALINVLAHCTRIGDRRGALTGIFLMWYGTARCAVELLREPDVQIGHIAFGWLTMGQILSAPMIIVGAIMLILAMRRRLSNI